MMSDDLVPYTVTTAVFAWAADGASVVTAEKGVTPFHLSGDQMLKLGPDAKVKQFVNELGTDGTPNPVSAASIDAGIVKGLFTACFNQAAGALSVLNATITLDFLDDNQVSVGTASLSADVANGNPGEWTHIDLLDVDVPVGARGVEAIIEFDTTDLNGFSPIYLDKTHVNFSVVPEPASLLLALCGISMSLLGRRSTRS